MQKMTKVLFLSKDNLTANPRLKKELLLARQLGWEVTFVGFDLQNWTKKIEEQVKKSLQNVKLFYLSASRKNFDLLWLTSVLVEKFTRVLYIFNRKNLWISAFAHSRRSFALWWWLKWHRKKYDLVIAHTLPSIFPAYKFSSRVGAKWIFDVEDYHPGEKISKDVKFEKMRREQLLRSLLPKTSAFTYASPLIGEQIIRLLSQSDLPEHSFIANSFPQKYFRLVQENGQKVRFVWFSQNIAPDRGLELLLPALWQFKDKVEITLIGNLYSEFWNSFLSQYSTIIKILSPMSEDKLYAKICEYDVGCAIELTSADLNKDIALSNKIYAYAQAGLYILATDTRAQKLFLTENPELGTLTGQNTQEFSHKIQQIIKDIEKIRAGKPERFRLASRLSWDNEQKKVIQLWQKVLNEIKA